MTPRVGRSRVAAVGAGCVAVLLVLGATALGLRLPSAGVLDRFADRTALDYRSRYVSRFAPLRDAFVDARLGDDVGSGRSAATTDVARTTPAVEPAPTRIEHAATNDRFADAYPLRSVPITVTTATTGATREAGEPDDCSPVGGTVWYRYTPPRDETLIADTFGTRYGNAVGIFTGSSLRTLRREACDAGPTGNAAVTLLARRGVTYFFQVTGFTRGGALVFNVQPVGSTRQVDGAAGANSPIPAGDGPAVSGSGRYVAFVTTPQQDADGCADHFCHFVRDLELGRTTLLASSEPVVGPPWPDYGFDLSADARYLAFTSSDPSLVRGDTNRANDVYVVDRVTRLIERVSVTSSGGEAKVDPVVASQRSARLLLSGSLFPSISSDGRFVAFVSDANNLDPRATSGTFHTYVHDRASGRTELVSVDSEERAIGGMSRYGRAISGSGRYVLFGPYIRDRLRGVTTRLPTGAGASVISEDGARVAFVKTTDSLNYVYVYDLATRRVTLASVSSDGKPHGSPVGTATVYPGTSTFPRLSLSSDGRYVAFDSYAPGLVAGDSNGVDDVFVHDLENRTTSRVSLRSDGSQMTADSYAPSISGDGRVVGFLNDTADRNAFVHTSVVAGRP